MKFDTVLRKKIAGRSSYWILAAIFFSGILVGIIVTVLAIASLPDPNSGIGSSFFNTREIN